MDGGETLQVGMTRSARRPAVLTACTVVEHFTTVVRKYSSAALRGLHTGMRTGKLHACHPLAYVHAIAEPLELATC
jgi:hypothetical protein